ncbi:MAG: Dolichyl-phosphate-mannose-protein mannosyltransferase [Gaiellaceae bacterium]|nr:Dolichyl-phosphate-mannose-protein mannosyltransferase [Gaiellaceae bacterium]
MQTPAVAKPGGESTARLVVVRVRDGVPLAVLWILAASVLAELTTRALDWFAKDDELRYERLAISIARTHSLVPRIHGVNIESYSQLYPLLIAPFFRHGLVPQNVHTVHLVNAWIMSSACIPAFFLARRVTGRRWAAYLAAALTVAMPWILLSAMMMTEVASYPAFILALVAMQRATVAPSRRNDLFALAAIAIAYFARGSLLVLIVVYPLAVIAYEVRGGERSIRRLVKRHDLLAAVSVVVLLTAVGLRVTGALSRVAGVYGRYAQHEQLLPHGIYGSFVEHMATFSLAFGVLPFVGGVAWLLANAARPGANRERHAFAWIGAITIAAVMFQSTNFDVLYNAFVHDRFLLFLVPIVVISVLCAALDTAPLRWSLPVPAVLVALGFAVGAIPFATWGQFETIDNDAVIGAVYRPLVHAFGSLAGARVALVLFTLCGSALLLLGGRLLPRLRIAAVLAVVLVVALPATTAYAFARFFGTNDWASRPITNPQVEQFSWVDKTVGRNSAVTIATYPVSSNWFVNFRVWRDYQYWNASIDQNVEMPRGVFTYSSFWFPKVYWHFDPTTGLADVSLTPYVLEADQESRFRVSGKEIANSSTDGLRLIAAELPWRTDWLSFGLYDDGWTRPGVTARVRIFATPGQRGAVLRGITFGIRAPDDVSSRPFELRSAQAVVRGVAAQDTVFQGIHICVPAGGYADVRLRTPDTSPIPGDLATLATSLQPRTGGVFVSQIGLADELGGACKPSAAASG